MQTSHEVQQAMRKLGAQGIPLTRGYRLLFNRNLFLTAYGNIYCNKGALTPGTDENDTMDGMSVERMDNLIQLLREEKYDPPPSRRTSVPKKSGGRRYLGLPNGSEKLVQEVLRIILEAYYEPKFRDSSHGYRPERGCHTALKHVKTKFQNATWFIEGDIKGCFDNIDHDILLGILKRDIHDGRLIHLIDRFLKAGYIEDWEYRKTYSGTPQGGILSPLLSNIYLNELDRFIEDELMPQHNRGKRRATNPAYKSYSNRIERRRRNGQLEEARELELERRQLPAVDPNDPNFRRLQYVRYADDWLLGFIGPKAEALEIKEQVKHFLRERLRLELSEEKTFITHAKTQSAHFLGYAISIYQANDSLTRRSSDGAKRRSINGIVRLAIPEGLIDKKISRYYHGGKITSDTRFLQSSVPLIILTYQQRLRGLVQYYQYAMNVSSFSKLKYAMEISLVKTLAHKLRIPVTRVYKRFKSTHEINGYTYKVLKVEYDTGKRISAFHWGAIPLRTTHIIHEPMNDNQYDYERFQYFEQRSELITRLMADTCEMCGATGQCEVHHVRKLADLKTRWQHKQAKPAWVTKMIAMQRKTLIVCKSCHWKIHNGDPLPQPK
ncbi:MAG: reverse transcriptase domain-containing protein [Nitrososphaera sp.]|nr:reverse transcriptase domain-containing protein [Nitrososphaera sp.]